MPEKATSSLSTDSFGVLGFGGLGLGFFRVPLRVHFRVYLNPQITDLFEDSYKEIRIKNPKNVGSSGSR